MKPLSSTASWVASVIRRAWDRLRRRAGLPAQAEILPVPETRESNAWMLSGPLEAGGSFMWMAITAKPTATPAAAPLSEPCLSALASIAGTGAVLVSVLRDADRPERVASLIVTPDPGRGARPMTGRRRLR